jgi:bifunctional enzyme CysN/CysC
LIDPATNVTVGAGMIRAGSTESNGKGVETEARKTEIDDREQKTKETPVSGHPSPVSPDVVWEPWNISREEREKRNGHKAMVLWFTGISGAGKSTIARALEKKLWEEGKQTMLLDGDQVRHGLNGDLGFSSEDRSENIRRVGEVGKLFFEHGNIVLCTFVSPFRKDREAVRKLFPEGCFHEIYVTCSPETAQERDPKGLYEKAKKGEITNLTGFDGEYQKPDMVNSITIETDFKTVQESIDELLQLIMI